MDIKVLVTGAGGFIGSHLIEHLVVGGYDVRAVVHYNAAGNWHNLEKVSRNVLDNIEIMAGDIADPYFVDDAVAGCEIVFHLAALIAIPYSYIAPAAYVNTNVVGTLNILQACRRHRTKRVIHTSTSETYGTAQYVPIDEKHPLVGQSPYSATKIGADKLVESYHRSFALPAVTVRPFNTYGPRQSARAVIPTIIAQALQGDVIKLGSLDPVRDLTYVEDTARGMIAAAKSEKVLGEVVNLGCGMGYSIGEIVHKVERLMGKKLNIVKESVRVRPHKSEVMRLISNNLKAKALAGWEPGVALDDGLQQTINYIRENLTEYKADQYNV